MHMVIFSKALLKVKKANLECFFEKFLDIPKGPNCLSLNG